MLCYPRQASPSPSPVGIFAASIKDPVLLKAHTLNPGLMTPAAASSSLAPRAPSAPWGKHSAGLAHRAGFLICATLRCQASSASAGVCQPLKCSPTPPTFGGGPNSVTTECNLLFQKKKPGTGPPPSGVHLFISFRARCASNCCGRYKISTTATAVESYK